MKKVLLASVLLVSAASVTTVARADDDNDHPGPGWMSVSQVAHELRGMGYSRISKIEADDGLWEAHAARDGTLYEVKLDPYDGRLVNREVSDDDDD